MLSRPFSLSLFVSLSLLFCLSYVVCLSWFFCVWVDEPQCCKVQHCCHVPVLLLTVYLEHFQWVWLFGFILHKVKKKYLQWKPIWYAFPLTAHWSLKHFSILYVPSLTNTDTLSLSLSLSHSFSFSLFPSFWPLLIQSNCPAEFLNWVWHYAAELTHHLTLHKNKELRKDWKETWFFGCSLTYLKI